MADDELYVCRERLNIDAVQQIAWNVRQRIEPDLAVGVVEPLRRLGQRRTAAAGDPSRLAGHSAESAD